MFNGFWISLTPQSGALAAWVAAFATILLVLGLWQTWLAMNKSARSASFTLMQGRFNAPDMLYARAILARAYLDSKDGDFWKNHVPPAWRLVHFLNQVGHLVDEKRIDFDDVVLAYADHITRIGGRWGSELGSDCRENRYAPFLRLHERVQASKTPRMFMTELDEHYDEEFWKCEASLYADANSEG